MVFAFLLARFKHVLEFCGTINVVAMRWFTSSSHLTEALNCCSVWNSSSVMESTVDCSKPVWLHKSPKSFLESRRECVVIWNKDENQPIQWQTLTNIKQIWIFLVLQEPHSFGYLPYSCQLVISPTAWDEYVSRFSITNIFSALILNLLLLT